MEEYIGSRVSARERVTDIYLYVMLFAFPLFSGFEGYANITFSKYAFLLAATGLWLAAAAFLSLRERRGFGPPGVPQWAALAFLGVSALSWFISPWRAESFVGAGRFDGLLTTACYVLTFLGVSLCGTSKTSHLAAFAAGMFLCCCVGVLQLFGLDPLRLFPGDYTYYDAGVRYSGAYLGTIGNTNILDAALCTALPPFAALYVRGESKLFLLPLVPGAFVLVRAGGSGAAVAFAGCALAAMPLLLTDAPRLRRGLRCAATVLAPAAFALAYAPDSSGRSLTVRFALTPAVLAVGGAAVALWGLSFLFPRRFAPSGRTLRRFFLGLDAALVLGGAALLILGPWKTGTLYELKSALRGELEDSFGSSRIRIWQETLALVPERPLLGGGPGTLAARLDIAFSRYVPETGGTLHSFVDNAHSVYLGYLVNCGILGLAAYLTLMVSALREAYLRRTAPLTAAVGLGTFCAALHGTVGLGLCLSEPLFWIALGLACAREKEGILCPI